MLAGINVLYFTSFDEPWLLGPPRGSLLLGVATTEGTNPDFWIKMVFVFSGIAVLKIMRKKAFGDPRLGQRPVSGMARGLRGFR